MHDGPRRHAAARHSVERRAPHFVSRARARTRGATHPPRLRGRCGVWMSGWSGAPPTSSRAHARAREGLPPPPSTTRTVRGLDVRAGRGASRSRLQERRCPSAAPAPKSHRVTECSDTPQAGADQRGSRRSRPGRKSVEGPQDQRRRALVPHVVDLGRRLHEACADRVLERRAARHPVVESSLSLRDRDERRPRMCMPAGVAAGRDRQLLVRRIACRGFPA